MKSKTIKVARVADRGDTDHERAAMKRKEVAVQHLVNAAEELDAACADLSAVIGANVHYATIRKLSIKVTACRRLLDTCNNLPGDTLLMLDHKPSAAELEHGHGTHHGCGGVKE